ncbi:MAG: hypothetical protein Q8M92_08300, partial [Candidatus Subteraquimicrobiales bacterium]|nr:hypothetical protein [Candidatus Subteraquimicrobiales bacterium]
RNENYLGFGAGAHSHFSNLRFLNALSPQKYISLMQTERCAVEERIKLTIEDEIKETIFLYLRLVKGIKNKEFKKRFGKDLNLLYKKQIEKLTKLGLVSMGKTLKLTPGGRFLANQVFSEFV